MYFTEYLYCIHSTLNQLGPPAGMCASAENTEYMYRCRYGALPAKYY